MRHQDNFTAAWACGELALAQADSGRRAKVGRKWAVDTYADAPYAGFMNLQVPPDLEAKLARLASETGRTVDQVALDLLASSIDHDGWFRGEVELGRTAAREGRLLDR